MTVRYLGSLVLLVAVGFFVGRAFAQAPPSGAAAKPAPPPIPSPRREIVSFGTGFADQVIVKEAIYAACGESDATFLGEQGEKDTCKYFFKVAGAKEDETFVQVYAPPTKEVPDSPTDPFFKWGRIGKVFYTEKALSPKSAPMIANATGLWLPAKGYFVAVNASTKVCDKAQVKRLAAKMK